MGMMKIKLKDGHLLLLRIKLFTIKLDLVSKKQDEETIEFNEILYLMHNIICLF